MDKDEDEKKSFGHVLSDAGKGKQEGDEADDVNAVVEAETVEMAAAIYIIDTITPKESLAGDINLEEGMGVSTFVKDPVHYPIVWNLLNNILSF